MSARIPNSINQTHIKDMKDPEEVLLPSRDLVLIALGEDKSDQ